MCSDTFSQHFFIFHIVGAEYCSFADTKMALRDTKSALCDTKSLPTDTKSDLSDTPKMAIKAPLAKWSNFHHFRHFFAKIYTNTPILSFIDSLGWAV